MTKTNIPDLFLPPHGYISDIAPDSPHLALTWDGEGPRVASAASIEGLPFDEAASLLAGFTSSGSNVSLAGMIMLRRHQIELNHPAQFGMIQADTYGFSNESLTGYTAHGIFGAAWYGDPEALTATGPLGIVGGYIPEMLIACNSSQVEAQGLLARRPGWFFPGADPLQFGTPFIMLAFTSNGDPCWELRRVGSGQQGPRFGQSIPERPTAEWSDVDAVMALVDQCREAAADPDVDAAIRVLTDESEEMERERAAIEAAQGLQAARDAFRRPKDRIKPRLTETVVADAWRVGAANGMTRNGIRVAYHELTPAPLTWRVSSADKLKNLHAALSVRPGWGTENEEMEAFGPRLVAAVALFDSKLQVMRCTLPDEQNTVSFIVTRRPDLVREHRGALGVEGELEDLSV